jgi:hypothetical protein
VCVFSAFSKKELAGDSLEKVSPAMDFKGPHLQLPMAFIPTICSLQPLLYSSQLMLTTCHLRARAVIFFAQVQVFFELIHLVI